MAGRPKKEVDRSEAEKLCYLQCTRGEIASFFDVSEDTIDARVREWGFSNFQSFHKRYSEGGKISLRRYQYEAAKRGNTSMLIWLGKQYLGQSDIVIVDNPNEAYEEPESLKKDLE